MKMDFSESDWSYDLKFKMLNYCYGGERTPESFTWVRAKLDSALVVFDADGYQYDVTKEPDGSLTMHNIECKDGRSCYFEVDQHNALRVLSTNGMNVTIVDGVISIGRSPAFVEDVEQRLNPSGLVSSASL
jgi:hypothetical protein